MEGIPAIPIHEGRLTEVEQRQAEEAAAEQADADVADAGASLLDGIPVHPEVPERNWDDLTVDEKLDVLFGAVGEIVERLGKAEHNVMLVGQSLLRILHKAGEIELDGPRIEVPRMDVPRPQGSRGRRR